MKRLVTMALLGVAASACSGTSEREGAAVLDDPQLPDSGSSHRQPDAEADADELDASEEEDAFVPTDADRSDHGGQCTEDSACVALLSPGPCQQALCENGRCVMRNLPDGTSCDDGNACTSGDTCNAGECSFRTHDPNAPGCRQDATPGSLRFTEVMGNPAGGVDQVDGQWFELYGEASFWLTGLKLVYYEWEGAEPTVPASPVVHSLTSDFSVPGYNLFLRSQDPAKNGYGSTSWSYSGIQFSKTKNARLMLLASSWSGTFPVPENLIIAQVELPAGIFADEHAGRSWQRDATEPDSFCYTPEESHNEIIVGNYATPGLPNQACP